jgi:uncharacterized lipoprotein YmbA
MMRRPSFQFVIFLLSVSLLVGGGCVPTPQSAPTSFYVLSSLSGAETKKPTAAKRNRATIGVGPVTLASYLDRLQIVTRASRNQLRLADFHHWGEPLEDNVPRVLAENLSFLLSTSNVFVHPWRAAPPIDYQVAMEVMRFDADETGSVSLMARWVLSRRGRRETLLTRSTNITVPFGQGSYEEIASAMSKALAGLSREIAAAIQARWK